MRSRNGQALVPVALRDRDDEPEVRLHHRLLRAVVAALDALRELDLLRRGQQRDLADVLEEELERVGRDLGAARPRARSRLVLLGMDDRDLRLVEGGVELVELARLEIELVERECDLVRVEPAGLEPGLEQALRLVGREDVLDRCSNRRALRFPCDQSAPLARRRSHRSHRGGRRQSVQPCAGRAHPLFDRAWRIVSR